MLSGDDPVTVAVMAIGGRGVISVASNEAPAEMAQIVELCEKGDFAAARKLHHWLLPLIQVNFVETNPIPCKAAMAAMGLIEENYRLPMVPPTAAAREQGHARAAEPEDARRRRARVDDASRTSITELFEQGSAASKDAARDVVRTASSGASAGRVRAAEPDSASPTGWRVNVWVKQGILLGFRFGDIVDMGIGKGRWPFFDKDTMPLKSLDAGERRRIWCPADRRSATARISARASSACRRCTSTSAPTSATGRWSIRTRSSARARRSASAFT